MMSLLEAMNAEGVEKIVFSSSSSVYGNAASGLVEEDHPFNPTSPYGESKVIGEWLLRNQGVATGLVHTSLRYFNVVGSGDPTLPDVSH
jgi:UDP-glucose 4-epimerase